MGLWEWIILAFVIGGILYAFDIPESIALGGIDGKRVGKRALSIISFIPMILFGIVLHVFKDFKNHKVGYITLIIVISFVIFGFIMGMIAGPESPPAE